MAHVEYPAAVIAAAKELGVQLGSGEDYDPSDALRMLGREMALVTQSSVHGDLTPVKWNDDPDDPFAGDLTEYADFGGFSFKKLGRGIGKVAKGAVKGVKKVASSKAFQVVMPIGAIAVHTSDKALGGKGVIKGKLGRIVDTGTGATLSIVPAGNAMGALGKKFGPTLNKAVTSSPQLLKSVGKTVTPRGVLSFGVPANGNVKAAMAQADKLLGGKANNAALVVRNTQALAALGDPSAKRGLAVLNAVGTIRVAKKAPPGKPVVPPVRAKTPVVQKTSPAKVQTLVRATAAKKAADSKSQTWVAKVLGWFGLQVKL